MNKAITEGLLLMPPAFAGGLDVWSSGDGTPGSDTYQNAPNAALVPADQDFGGCLELQKTASVQRLRHMGETPLLPGCYLRITARIKAVSGNLPNVRIAAWAGGAGGAHVGGLTETGPSTTLQRYGEVVEVTAIVGSGLRTGVDMPWGIAPIYGHFGLDLTGPNGGVVRIDDLRIEDVTHVFHRDMMNWVDVRDFGAVGDGVADDHAAFVAADAAANGRRVLVSKGTFRIGAHLTMESRVRFEGTITMPADRIFSMVTQFDLPTYIAAFGDEELGFKKAFQSLLNNADHESLDMCGRRVSIRGPIDMAAAVANKNSYAQRRIIRNGQFYAEGDAVWDTVQVTSQATYSPANANTLTGVVNAANIAVGSLVVGTGVGREVYVRAVNVAASQVTLSEPLYDAAGTQVFTFRRFKYMLDFSGFEQLSKFGMENIEFQCNNKASGIMLARTGVLFHLKACYITRPANRGLTSIGDACQGMLIDQCHFLTGEPGTPAQQRVSIALNANANDVKLRSNWASQFRHFAILSGSNNVITGNHFYQGDSVADGVRMAGIALVRSNCNTTLVGNYVDNCFVEWTNEHDAYPDYTGGFGFAALTITNNVFLCGNVAPWFSYLVIKPYGTGHSVTGLNMTGNMFRAVNGTINRVERVDTTFAPLDLSKMRNIHIAGNTFNNVVSGVNNPMSITHTQNTEAATWTVDCAANLPFFGQTLNVESVVVTGKLKSATNITQFLVPYAEPGKGPQRNQVELFWEREVRGQVTMTVRMDR